MTGDGGGLQMWQPEEVLRRDNLHRGSIYCLAFSPDSTLLATGELKLNEVAFIRILSDRLSTRGTHRRRRGGPPPSCVASPRLGRLAM